MLSNYDMDYLKNDQSIKRTVELIEELDTELHRSFDQEIMDIQNLLVDDLRQLIINSKNGYSLSNDDITRIIDNLISPF